MDSSTGSYPAIARRSWLRWAYVPITLGIIVTILVAFWRSYFGPLLRTGSVDLPWEVHVHGAVYVGWLGLLAAQVWFARAGRLPLHRRIGQVGIYYGALVWVMGMIVTFTVPIRRIRSGAWPLDQGAAILIRTLGSMVLFAGFFMAAILYRRQPEIHKRLILGATVSLTFAGVGRISEDHGWFLLIWLSPMMALMAVEMYTQRRVHAVTALSTAILLVAYTRVLLQNTEIWLPIGRAMLRPLLL
jgi:hypothetical protein